MIKTILNIENPVVEKYEHAPGQMFVQKIHKGFNIFFIVIEITKAYTIAKFHDKISAKKL